MSDSEFSNPTVPFIETWAFRISLSQGAVATPALRLTPLVIRQRAINHLLRESSDATSSDHTADAIRQEVYDLVNNNLSSPDYHFFIADYLECPGSWEITFLVVGAFYGGVCGYGSFRKGLDYVYSDLKATFGAVSGIVARVHKQHRDRHALSRKIEPTLD